MPRFPARSAASGHALPPALAPATQFDSGGQCQLGFAATVELGPDATQTMQGTLSLSIGPDGAIDSGTLQLDDGTSLPAVGQATGRSLRLRIGSDPNSVITLVGSGIFPVDQCSGDLSGAFAGPGVQNVGVWIATGSTGA